MSTPIPNLITTYHDLNPAITDELASEPSPLEFHRHVARNRPFVVRGAAANWAAVRQWRAEYLLQKMRGRRVKVAVTPKGNADAVVERQNGQLVFVEPLEIEEPFADFFEDVRGEGHGGKDARPSMVKYAQTQNDNLRDEYSPLYSDVPPDILFARIALGHPAEAINLWIGTARSTTALHRDNYENIYVQVRGQKHFVLLPPVELPCVNEQVVSRGRYRRSSRGDGESGLEIHVLEDEDAVPVPLWDPDVPDQHASPYSHLSCPLRVTLEEGDLLYLPALWYHKVGQSVGEEGFACAVNYWYDMEFTGGFWAGNAFVREVVAAEAARVKYPELIVGEAEEREKEGGVVV